MSGTIGGLIGIATWVAFRSAIGDAIGYSGGVNIWMILLAALWVIMFAVVGTVVGIFFKVGNERDDLDT